MQRGLVLQSTLPPYRAYRDLQLIFAHFTGGTANNHDHPSNVVLTMKCILCILGDKFLLH
tara:strand:+ start:2813 stop:2992 length:180 start_codon:yes stop_codon:yes gene_type:complete